jgi:hypothetical protein
MAETDYKLKCEELEKELVHYKKVLGIGKYNPAGDGFSVLVEQLRQRNEFIKNFKISEKIGNVAKDDPVYVRATELIDTLPKMISNINALSLELRIEYIADDEKEKTGATSPQSLLKRD